MGTWLTPGSTALYAEFERQTTSIRARGSLTIRMDVSSLLRRPRRCNGPPERPTARSCDRPLCHQNSLKPTYISYLHATCQTSTQETNKASCERLCYLVQIVSLKGAGLTPKRQLLCCMFIDPCHCNSTWCFRSRAHRLV